MLRKSFTFDGRRYYVRAKTKEELIIKIHEKKKALEKGVISSNVIIEEWLEIWLETYKKPVVSDSWYNDIKSIIETKINPAIGYLQITRSRQAHFQGLINKYSHLSGSYIKKIYYVLLEAFEKLVENQLIAINPVKGVVLPAGKKPSKRRSITDYERAQIIKLSKTHRAGLFLMIILFCGLRPGEVAALEWRHIDLEKRRITVERALKRDGSVGPPKSASGIRKVPVPDELLLMLKKGSPFDIVAPQAGGSRHTRTSIRQMWNSFIYNLNIQMGCKTYKGGLKPPLRVADDLVMYNLRHTYCTDLQAAGVPINVARELMGHADIATTAKIYTHSSEEPIEKALQSLNDFNSRCAKGRAKKPATVAK